MAKFFRNLSLVSLGLRHKLMAAFCLMAIIPLLILAYMASNYIFPKDTGLVIYVSLIILLTILLALLGFILAGGMVRSITKLAVEAKLIADGDTEHHILVKREDEIGDLERSLNAMTSKLRENMAEIQSYGERIRIINMDINKKVMVLSSLLQVGNVIAITPQLETIMPVIVDKLAQIADTEKVFLMLTDWKTQDLVARYVHNIEFEEMEELRTRLGEGLLGGVASDGERLVIDSSRKLTKPMEEFTKKFDTENLCLIPISFRGKVVGLVGLGNNLPEYTYKKDDLELLSIFVRQAAVAIENDWLIKRTKELARRDELTGLYNERYMKERLSEEIERAVMCQRPCSLVLINIDDFKNYKQLNGELAGNKLLRQVAGILSGSVAEIEKVARTQDDNFAIILPERNKGEAKDKAEEIRRIVEKSKFPGAKAQPLGKLTISAGVSANPIDGISAEDLINKALAALIKSKKEGKNRVEA